MRGIFFFTMKWLILTALCSSVVFASDIEYTFRDSNSNLLFEVGSCIFALIMVLLVLYFANRPKKGTPEHLRYRIKKYLEK